MLISEKTIFFRLLKSSGAQT